MDTEQLAKIKPSQNYFKATPGRGSVFAGLGLFFGYELFITLSSLAFVALGALLQSGADELIAWSSPLGVVVGILAASTLKGWIALGLYRKEWKAWVLGLGTVSVGVVTTFCQLLGVLTNTPVWWLFVRFESGGNLGLIWSVVFGDGIVVQAILLSMLGVYIGIAHQLWSNKQRLVDSR